jgi:preprotein translocase subunit YajC
MDFLATPVHLPLAVNIEEPPTSNPAQSAPAAPVIGAGGGAGTGPATTMTTQEAAATQKALPPAGGGGVMGAITQFLPFILIFAALYLFLFRGQRKEEKKRKSMIELMKKGDEVMTIGGLVGKVVEVREDRVVLKVDESANVKETYLKSAIQRVLAADGDEKK